MAAPSTLYKVFVYGTLKRGEPNHQWFGKDQKGHYKFLYDAKTIEKFPLIIGTKYNIPLILHSPGGYLEKVRLGYLLFFNTLKFNLFKNNF